MKSNIGSRIGAWMKEVDNITKVVLYKTGDDSEKPSSIATLYVKEKPAIHHMRKGAIKVVKHIAALVDRGFEVNSLLEEDHIFENSIWIVTGEEYEDTPSKIRVIHRNWDGEQVEVFKEVLRLLAHLYSWEISE